MQDVITKRSRQEVIFCEWNVVFFSFVRFVVAIQRVSSGNVRRMERVLPSAESKANDDKSHTQVKDLIKSAIPNAVETFQLD